MPRPLKQRIVSWDFIFWLITVSTLVNPVLADTHKNAQPGQRKYQTTGEIKIRPEMQMSTGVKTTTVEFGQLQQTLKANGRIAFDDTMIDKLSPRVTGWVDELFVDSEGEMVKYGQALYSLYSPELIDIQQAFLEAYQSGEDHAVREAESLLKAHKVDEITITKLKQQGAAQRSVVFHAQRDGVVGKLMVSNGDYVEPGSNIMAIGSLENVWAELNVFSSQASLIQRGQLISITTPSYPGAYWEGEIEYIHPALGNHDRSLLFRANIDNPQMRLKPNMPVEAEIQLPDREESLLVPYQAVIRLGHQDRVVWALPNNRFKSVEVTLGESNEQWVEVIDGLEEGDKIVTSAHFLIDSESSKVSDFIRMSTEGQNEYRPTRVIATIREIDLANRTLLLQHEPIKAWRMPAMTMTFQATERVDLGVLKKGQRIRAQIANGDPLFLLLEAVPTEK